MKRLRTLSITLFIASLILFGINYYRTNIVEDKTGPVFHIEDNTVQVSVKDNEDALLKGLTATDATDGDVTASVIVESISPFTGTGRRIVNYAAFDSDNHVTHARRELVYTDYRSSQFRLSKPLSFALNATNLLDGITVDDCLDGDLTKSVKLMSDEEIDTSHVGEYAARLKVTNSAGGVSYLPVTIEIYDASVQYRRPQLKLKDYVVYLEKGEYFDEEEYLSSITINGTEYSMTDEAGTYGARYVSQDETDETIGYNRVDIESDVDTDVSGYYEVTYTFDDTVENTGTGHARLYVVILEGRADGK
ncbi:MAG: hypothetical protein J6E40_12045 [Lachnospiraceae bacterium]|nr:hypothetical protein [Lachnospiraceae bacterium]